MARLLVVLLAAHGALHLLGFLKWSKLTEIPQLGGRTLLTLTPATALVFGGLWLAALVVLLAAAGLVLAGVDRWWVVGLVGIVLSQGLVIMAWPDAKLGSIANAFIAVAIVVSAAHMRFPS